MRHYFIKFGDDNGETRQNVFVAWLGLVKQPQLYLCRENVSKFTSTGPDFAWFSDYSVHVKLFTVSLLQRDNFQHNLQDLVLRCMC